MQTVLSFLTQLRDNNNREWFEANRTQYEHSRWEFEQFVKSLLQEMTVFEPEMSRLAPKDCIFRIYRDVRFSKDKTPYKIAYGAYFAPGGKKSTKAGYYLHLEPDGKSMLAGGMYMPTSDMLKKIRQEIDYNGEILRQILNDPNFQQYYNGLSGEKVKTTPKGYAADHAYIEWLKHKDFTAIHNLDDQLTMNAKLLLHSVTVFQALQPLNNFLNTAVEQ